MLATVSFYGVLAAIFFYVLRYDSGFRDSSSVVIAFAGISLCLLVNGQLLTLLLVAFAGFALAKKVQAIEVELMDALSSLTGAEKARKTAASQLESLRNELTLTGLNAELKTRLQAKAEQARAEAERARAEAERAREEGEAKFRAERALSRERADADGVAYCERPGHGRYDSPQFGCPHCY
jgi:hypothetical protein